MYVFSHTHGYVHISALLPFENFPVSACQQSLAGYQQGLLLLVGTWAFLRIMKYSECPLHAAIHSVQFFFPSIYHTAPKHRKKLLAFDRTVWLCHLLQFEFRLQCTMQGYNYYSAVCFKTFLGMLQAVAWVSQVLRKA